MTRPNDGPQTGPNRIFDDFSRLMTNAMGVAQGAKDEAETAMKGWVDRWLADRNFVTREEFEAVREMAIKARTENAELRAMIQALGGGAAGAPHVSTADAPAATMRGTAGSKNPGDNAPHVSAADAPAADMAAGGSAGLQTPPAGENRDAQG